MYFKVFNVFFSLFALLLYFTYLIVIILHLFLQQFLSYVTAMGCPSFIHSCSVPKFCGLLDSEGFFFIKLVLVGTEAVV